MVKQTGRWTQEEKKQYQEARSQFGRSWVRISEFFSTRTATQCRSHGQKSDHELIASDNKITYTPYYQDLIL